MKATTGPYQVRLPETVPNATVPQCRTAARPTTRSRAELARHLRRPCVSAPGIPATLLARPPEVPDALEYRRVRETLILGVSAPAGLREKSASQRPHRISKFSVHYRTARF
jgi:hypothetical protein